MELLTNLDLVSVGFAVAGMVLLGTLGYFSDKKSKTNQLFLYFALSGAIWSILNYLFYQVQDPSVAFWIIRFVIFTGCWYVFFLFSFLYVFPNTSKVLPVWYNRILLPLTVLVSSVTLTPLVFKNISAVSDSGKILEIENGPGIILFAGFVLSLVSIGIFLFIRKTFQVKHQERKQHVIVLIGFTITFVLTLTFNLVFPAFFDKPDYIPLGALFIFPLIAFISYAVIQHRLFNAKAVAIGVLSFALSVVILLEVIFAESLGSIIFKVGEFFLVIVFSIFLLKGVIKEVKQREQIQELATNLKKANDRLKELDRLKSEFVSIASHQLRSPLTAMKGYASLILEGSFGSINDSVKEAVQKIFDSSNLMTVSVQDFLDVSRIEQGKMKYNFEDFDLSKLVETTIEELSTVAREKNLKLNLEISDGSTYKVNADIGKIKQVIYNLVDNSIKYTPKGSVTVRLFEKDSKYCIEIQDTGVGISAESLPKLFGKFVRTRNAHHVNVSGTGLGLFVVKQMIEAHKGRVWVTSPGEGKGSTFHVELQSL